jgi:hypothetical protein
LTGRSRVEVAEALLRGEAVEAKAAIWRLG